MLGGEHRCLPDGALVHLRVADQHERSPFRALQARSERGSGADRKTLAERAGREVDARNDVLRMGAERRPVRAEGRERLGGHPPGGGQGGIERERSVSLGEDEAIPIAPILQPQHLSEEHGEHVRDAEGGADMTHVGAVGLLDDAPTDPLRESGNGGCHRAGLSTWCMEDPA